MGRVVVPSPSFCGMLVGEGEGERAMGRGGENAMGKGEGGNTEREGMEKDEERR